MPKKPAVLVEGPDAARRFEDAIGRVLRVSKEELAKREGKYRDDRKKKIRSEPKPSKP